MRSSRSITLSRCQTPWELNQQVYFQTSSQHLMELVVITPRVNSNLKPLWPPPKVIMLRGSRQTRMRRRLYSSISTTTGGDWLSSTSRRRRRHLTSNRACWRRTSLGIRCLSVISRVLTCGCWSRRSWTEAEGSTLSTTWRSWSSWSRGTARAGPSLTPPCPLPRLSHPAHKKHSSGLPRRRRTQWMISKRVHLLMRQGSRMRRLMRKTRRRMGLVVRHKGPHWLAQMLRSLWQISLRICFLSIRSSTTVLFCRSTSRSLSWSIRGSLTSVSGSSSTTIPPSTFSPRVTCAHHLRSST